jgi:hypothetical protein
MQPCTCRLDPGGELSIGGYASFYEGMHPSLQPFLEKQHIMDRVGQNRRYRYTPYIDGYVLYIIYVAGEAGGYVSEPYDP